MNYRYLKQKHKHSSVIILSFQKITLAVITFRNKYDGLWVRNARHITSSLWHTTKCATPFYLRHITAIVPCNSFGCLCISFDDLQTCWSWLLEKLLSMLKTCILERHNCSAYPCSKEKLQCWLLAIYHDQSDGYF